MLYRWVPIVFVFALFFGCKKTEPTHWDTEWTAPLVTGRLDISDISDLQDISAEVNYDNSVTLVYEKDLLSFSVESLADIPDTTVVKKLTIPFSSINVPPGVGFFDEPQNFTINGIDAALTYMKILSGQISYKMESPVDQATVVTYSIPGASKNGQPLSLTFDVPAAVNGQNAVVTGVFDLSGYELDLRGVSGSLHNTFESNFVVQVSNEATANVILTQADTIYMTNTFQDIVPQYARGYFGKHNLKESSSSTATGAFSGLIDGHLDIDQLKVKLYTENGIGADGRIRINSLQAMNYSTSTFMNLHHNLIGSTININRAIDHGNGFTPSRYETTLNTLNSNIDLFLETLPQSIAYDAEFEVNPLGNVSNGTDFLYHSSAIKTGIRVEMPLTFKTNLVLQDTFDLDIEASSVSFNTLSLHVESENHFPLTAELLLFVLDENGFVADTVQGGSILSGTIGPQQNVVAPSNNTFTIALSESATQTLNKSGRIILRYVLKTPPSSSLLTIHDDNYIDIKITTRAGVKVQLK